MNKHKTLTDDRTNGSKANKGSIRRNDDDSGDGNAIAKIVV